MKDQISPSPEIILPLSWQFRKRSSKLKSSESTLVNLKTMSKNKAVFEWDNRTFSFRNKGFWNPKITLEENGTALAVIKRSFSGNKAFFTFENGNTYLLKAKNNVLIKLSVYNSDKKEIINYRLISKLKATLYIDQSIKIADPAELLVLIVGGYYVFRMILKENKVVNMKSLNFVETPDSKKPN